jgi:hypothetical protein
MVFLPPLTEGFDTIECARRAAKHGTSTAVATPPLVLPTIDVLTTRASVAKAIPLKPVLARSRAPS